MLQVEYPNNVHLIRGNHEAADINALFGFRIECIERMVICLTYATYVENVFALFWIQLIYPEWILIRVREMESGFGTG